MDRPTPGTLAPVSIAGYVRTLKASGNWLHVEELSDALAFRGLRKPRVPVKLIEAVPDDTLRRLLGLASATPRPHLLRRFAGRGDAQLLGRETLALSKMDWNNDSLYDLRVLKDHAVKGDHEHRREPGEQVRTDRLRVVRHEQLSREHKAERSVLS